MYLQKLIWITEILVEQKFLCFMTRKYTLLETLRKKIVEIKAAEPCATVFWKKQCNFKIEKTHGC